MLWLLSNSILSKILLFWSTNILVHGPFSFNFENQLCYNKKEFQRTFDCHSHLNSPPPPQKKGRERERDSVFNKITSVWFFNTVRTMLGEIFEVFCKILLSSIEPISLNISFLKDTVLDEFLRQVMFYGKI